jgi:hypothetical protein
MNIKPSPNTRIGAVRFVDILGVVHIRVYYQGEYFPSLKSHPFIETPRRGRIPGHQGIVPRRFLDQRAASTRGS